MSPETPGNAPGRAWPSELYTRYSRHLILPEVGVAGQERLRRSSVAIVGMGGLGSPAAMYLAAAGVGRLGLFDFDNVDLTNLQRQTIHSVDEIGEPKVASAGRRLRRINPDVEVETHNMRLSAENAAQALESFETILDGCDNFPTRYLINDICVFQRKPMIYGAIFRFHGQAAVLGGDNKPCYRCLFPEPPDPDEVPSCAEGGVFGFLPGMIGVLQASECVKILLGIGEPLRGRLLLVDSLAAKFREVRVARDRDCPVCGDHPTIREPVDYEEFCGLFEEDEPDGIPEIEPEEVAQRLREQPERLFLLDVRTPAEVSFAAAAGAVNIPLSELGERMVELDPQRERRVAVICRDGRRSRRACRWLHDAGFPDVAHVTGGMIAWSRRVDPDAPVY